MPSKIPFQQPLPLLRIVKRVRFELNASSFGNLHYDDGVRFETNGSTLHSCKISARFHSLTEMSRDRNIQTKSARPNRPDRNVSDRNSQTETSQTETARPKSPVPFEIILEWELVYAYRLLQKTFNLIKNDYL